MRKNAKLCNFYRKRRRLENSQESLVTPYFQGKAEDGGSRCLYNQSVYVKREVLGKKVCIDEYL